MLEATPNPRWRMLGASVPGASHVRVGIGNQDSIAWLSGEDKERPWVVLAVSDGHGSEKSFRSSLGASLAVEMAQETGRFFLTGETRRANLSSVKRIAEEKLPQVLVRQWREAVERHHAEYPFTTEELSRLERREGQAARRIVEDNPLLAYGATLIASLISDDFIAYLQLGDGDILSVSLSGEVSRPIPADHRLIANETTSLCSPDSWKDFRFAFHVISEQPPALIMMSTDGYANSFRNDDEFRKVGPDLLELVRSEGIDRLEVSLAGWLKEASEEGSGDDVTVGIGIWLGVVGSETAESSKGLEADSYQNDERK